MIYTTAHKETAAWTETRWLHDKECTIALANAFVVHSKCICLNNCTMAIRDMYLKDEILAYKAHGR